MAAFIADYRLAPGHPFPSAVNDNSAVNRGLAASGFSRLALAGDSAGGGLALSLLLLATKESEEGSLPRPVAVAVMCHGLISHCVETVWKVGRMLIRF